MFNQGERRSRDRIRHPVCLLGLHLEMSPDQRPGERLNAQDYLTILENADRAGGLTDSHGDRVRLAADGGRRPMPGAETFTQRDPFGENVQEHARRNRNTIAADDDRSFQLGDVLDLLAYLAIPDIALRLAVT